MLPKILPVTLALIFSLVTVANSQASDPDAPFSMTIQDTMRVPKKGVVITGQIEQGQVKNGELVCVPLVAGGTISSQVDGMEKMSRLVDTASAGDHVGILVSNVEEDDIAVGMELHGQCE